MDELKQFINRHKRLLQGSISIVFLTVLIWQSNIHELLGYIADAPLIYLIPWFIFYDTVGMFLGANKIYFLLKRLKNNNFKKILMTSCKLQIMAEVVPGRLGDLSLPYFLKDSYTIAQSTAVLIVDKIISLSLTSIVAIVGVGVILSWFYLAATGIVVITISSLFFITRGSKVILRYFHGFFFNKIDDLLSEIIATINNFKGIIWNISHTLLQVVLAGISYTLILKMFGEDVDLWHIVAVQAIIQIITIVPVTVNGIGLAEGTLVFLLGRVGTEAEVVLAASISGRIIHLIFMILLSLFWFRNTVLVNQK